MPGKPRLFVPGCVYHVMARGLNGMDIFVDDDDRRKFLDLYRIYNQRTGMRCYAWALMSNHYHFVIRTSDIPLAKLFAPLHTRYAQYFNTIGKKGLEEFAAKDGIFYDIKEELK